MPGQGGIGRPDDPRSLGLKAYETLADHLGVVGEVDAPDDPGGEWWFDLASGHTVSWRPGRGYGIYTSDDDAIGERPDELYREADLAAKRLRQLAVQRTGEADPVALRLSDVRGLVDRQQAELANALKKDQAAISRLERQNDALLSTIRDYVETLGGELRLSVRFPGFEAPLHIPRKERPSARRGRPKRTAAE